MEDPEKHQMSTDAMRIGEPHGEMPGGEMGSGQPAGGLQRMLVEIRVPRAQGAAYALQMAAGMNVPGFQLDTGYESVPVSPTPDQAAQLAAAGEEVVIVLGTIEKSKIPELEAQPNIVKVYLDTPIATFTEGMLVEEKPVFVTPSPALAPSPIPPCDCDPGTAKGAIADVARPWAMRYIARATRSRYACARRYLSESIAATKQVPLSVLAFFLALSTVAAPTITSPVMPSRWWRPWSGPCGNEHPWCGNEHSW
jgi:hypothetical protein